MARRFFFLISISFLDLVKMLIHCTRSAAAKITQLSMQIRQHIHGNEWSRHQPTAGAVRGVEHPARDFHGSQFTFPRAPATEELHPKPSDMHPHLKYMAKQGVPGVFQFSSLVFGGIV